ncbi:hypothetical protein CcCBS67573_g03205 [Chytriomyces confervae]|uniref:F-box domain-containing protein n=1 Tax=Chytriomyces confervae TaxID=246404 RepID=A0A507FJG3_9FUNG|nr:hypothetical protein CcCBS67573_g03205 [Chytriomyces confervae]
MNDFPIEVLKHVFLQLEPLKIAKYRRVCRSFNNVLTAHPFSNVIALVLIGDAYGVVEVFCFVTPETFGKAFLTMAQNHVDDARCHTRQFWELDQLEGAGHVQCQADWLHSCEFSQLAISKDRFRNPLVDACMQLKTLICHQNRFSGSDSIFRLPLLQSAKFDGNLIISESLSTDKASSDDVAASLDLTPLNIALNALKGGRPTLLLSHLDLSCNQLSGRITTSSAPEIEELSNLLTLNLGSNQISGAIPCSISGLVLDLCRNLLVGRIPDSITSLVNLSRIVLEHDELGGRLPTEIGLLYSLEFLNLSHNRFLGGPMHPDIGALTKLNTLDLSHNQLTGTAPERFLLWCLDANCFSGTLPCELLKNMKQIKKLDLSNNQFSGLVHDILDTCRTLDLLDLSCNHFEGICLSVKAVGGRAGDSVSLGDRNRISTDGNW